MINGNYLKGQLAKRDIKVESEKNFAGNDIRFFIFKGQKIYFDTETVYGGTVFSWSEEEAKNLLFVLDHVKEDEQLIYYKVNDDIEVNFNWGYKDYMTSVNFSGLWVDFNGNVCKEVG